MKNSHERSGCANFSFRSSYSSIFGKRSVKGHEDLLFSSGSCYNFVCVVLFELLQRFNEKSGNSKKILFCFHEVIELFQLHAGYTFVTNLKFLIKTFLFISG